MASKKIMEYVNPFDREYSLHYNHVVQFNLGVINQIYLDLIGVFEEFKGKIAVTTTGSDGRLEKCPLSPMEIRVYGEGEDLKESTYLIGEYVSKEEKIKIFGEYIEPKDLSNNRMSYLDKSTENGRTLLLSPNRFFDSEILFQQGDAYKKASKKFVGELRENKCHSILSRLKKKSKEYKSVTISGKQKWGKAILNHYDLEQGVAFYDPEHKLWSVKQGPLRLVQFSLVKDLVRKIRENNSDSSLFLNLPKNTIEKISRIEAERMTPLSSAEINDLSDCYKFFLHLYHKSQFCYVQNGEKLVEFDSKEVGERCNTLERICSSPIIN